MNLTKKWLVAIAVCLLLLITSVYFFDWNLARPYIARKISSATGRSFAINGNLEVHLSLRPRIIVDDVVLGNAAWSKYPLMAQIRHADFKIDLLKLLGGHLSFPEITLSELQLVLEENKDGKQNWIFDQQGKQQEFPNIDALAIDRGTLNYRDATVNTDLTLTVNTADAGKDDPESMLELSGKGRFKGIETLLKARGGALLTLRSADQPYPIRAKATLGTTKVSINGTLLDPLHLRGQELNFQLEGSNLAQLFTIVDMPLPTTPAYKLAGFLGHSGDIWSISRFKGTVGSSDLSGDFSVDRGKTPQMITAELVSHSLNMKDLSGLIGVALGSKPVDKVLPSEPFSLAKLRSANADVRFRGAKIITQKIPLEKMDAHLVISDGTLLLAPLDFALAGGKIVSEITMDGRKSNILTHADITVKGLHLEQMLPATKIHVASAGTLGGRAKLDASGNSIAQMLGSANGDAALIMDGGSVSELTLRMSNLDIANSFLVLLGGDRQVPVRCMVANFNAVDGDFRVQDLVLDTPKVNISGEGSVNFRDESLHLKLVSKGNSLAALRGPIVISGTFKKPSAKPDIGKVAARGSLAVGLGVMTAGIGALLPLLEFDTDKGSNCAALMTQAKSDAGVRQSDIKPR
jgi:uncharacterized protein involved in outer membrane biogenesis